MFLLFYIYNYQEQDCATTHIEILAKIVKKKNSNNIQCFTKLQILNWSKLKAFADNKLNDFKMMTVLSDRLENTVE